MSDDQQPWVVWRVLDGKPGHENQSLGLVERLAELHPCQVESFPAGGPPPQGPPPQMLIGAGHRTHWTLLRLGRRHQAFTVVLMKPSLPLRWFDFCFVPQHDFMDRKAPPNVVLTEGALNCIDPRKRSDKASGCGLILLGGPSKEFAWDGESLRERIREILASGEMAWQITDSRRTPAGFLAGLESELGREGLQFLPHEQTPPGWLADSLLQCEAAWVGEDSVSMVYEALTSGAKVGLLPMPLRRSRRGRVARGIRQLRAAERLIDFDDWQSGLKWPEQQAPLDEARRCASILAGRFLERG